MQIGVGPSGPHRHFSHAQPSVSFLGVRKGQIWGEMGSEMGSPGFLLDPPRCFECHHQPAGTPISLFSFLSPQNHPECSSPSLQITHEKEKGKIPPCKTGSKTGREKGGQHPNPPPSPPLLQGFWEQIPRHCSEGEFGQNLWCSPFADLTVGLTTARRNQP